MDEKHNTESSYTQLFTSVPRTRRPGTCAGCLVVITDHGPRAEVAQALRHELLVDSGEGRLEGLEEERQKREEKEIGEERQPTHTQRTDDHACME